MLSVSDTDSSFLIIRLSSLGDILLTTPAVRCLRKTYPHARIDFLVKERYVELLKGNQNPSNIIALPEPADRKTLTDIIKPLRNHYQTVIDLHTGFRSAYVRRRLGTERTLKYDKKRFKRWLLVRFKKNYYDGDFSIPLAYLQAMQPLGVVDDGGGLDWPGALQKRESFLRFANLTEAPNPKPVALCPGASFFTKRWPVEKWRELAAILLERGENLWIFGEASDRETGEVLRSVNPAGVRNFCGKLNLQQAGAALSLCRVAITHDAGPSHMAVAVGTPVVAIFGSTVTQFGFRPFRIPHRIAEIELPCRPCSHLGFRECPQKHHDCMQRQSAQDVLRQIDDLIEEISA